MLQRIRFRNWVRKILQADIKAGNRDRGFLDREPWLKQLLPLGTYLMDNESNYIKVQRVDADVLLRDHFSKDVYFVSESGTILIKAKGFGTFRNAEPSHRAFQRLGNRRDLARYLVVVNCDNDIFPGWGEITIYNFPKNEHPVPFVDRLLEKHRVSTARRKTDDYDRGSVDAENELRT